MDPLASSHTASSRTGRRLLVMFVFALTFFRHSITAGAVAPASGKTQGVHSPSENSLAQFRIQGELTIKSNALLQQRGTERASLTETSPRRLLGDISPPGMWPTPDGQDPAPEEFRRRSLLTGAAAAPSPLGPWFVVMHSSQDGEDAFLRQALVAEKSYPLVPLALMIKKLKQLGSVLNTTTLAFKIRLPGSWRITTVVAEDNLERIDQQPGTGSQRVVVPPATDSSPDTTGDEMRSSTESVATPQQTKRAEGLQFPRRRLLQGDISPPGMWPDADDDESQLSESILLRRRRLMNM